MPILLKTQVDCTAKTPVTARRARGGGLCGFQDTVERVPTGSLKTGRCADVRERWRKMLVLARTAVGKAACGKRGKRRNGQNRGILDTAARKRRESRRKPWRFFAPGYPLLPAVRAVLRGENGAFLRPPKMKWRCNFKKAAKSQ